MLKNKHVKRMLVAAVAVMALTVGATAVFAQSGELPTVDDAEVPGMRGFGGGHFGGRGGMNSDMDSSLADELGIDVEALQAAREAVREAGLAQALADGDLTQEQFDMMAAREALRDYLDPQALLAEVLGVDEVDLEGKRLPEVIEEQGLDMETVRESLTEAHADAIAEAVSDGVITQEQADALAEFDGRGDFEQGMRGGEFGGRGMRGGMHAFPEATEEATD